MPKVKMLVDAPGSPDGVTVNEYEAGVTYDVPKDLADTFIMYDLAERAGRKATAAKPTGPAENKQADSPPENKMSAEVALEADDEPGFLHRLLHGNE